MDFLTIQGRPTRNSTSSQNNGVVNKVFDALGYIGETSEIAVRLAAYDKAQRRLKKKVLSYLIVK